MIHRRTVRRLVAFPHTFHAYNTLFARALEPHGILEEEGAPFSNRSLRDLAHEIDGVHFHFLQQLWPHPSSVGVARQIVGVGRYCRLAKRLGLPIIWTVHDLPSTPGSRVVPSSDLKYRELGDVRDERLGGRLTRLGMGMVSRYSDLIIVHSRSAQDQLESLYRPSCRIVQMRHGNYADIFKPRTSRSETLRAYGLDPNVPTLGMIGRMNKSRGHFLALETARLLDGQMQVLILGTAADPSYAADVARRAATVRSVVCRTGRLDDQSYADSTAACDAILLPYTDITTSGALMSAWTMARPVILSDVPLFRELAPADPAAGVVMAEFSPRALADAVHRLLEVPAERRAAAAAAESQRYAWDELVLPVVDAVSALWEPSAVR